MSFILFVWSIGAVCAQIRIPIVWSDSAPFAPRVQLTVDIPDVTSVTNLTSIDTFGGSEFFVHDTRVTDLTQTAHLGNLALLGSDMRWFGWEQTTERIRHLSCDPIGLFDVSIGSPFLRIANTFSITPNAVIINLRDPSSECLDPSTIEFVRGVFPVFGIDRWAFQVSDSLVQIDSKQEMIFLSPQDDARFVTEILNSLNEHSIYIDRVPHRPWSPRYINNCDMDLLDEILPILEFSISETMKIHITPKEYIYPYTGPGASQGACFVAVAASRTHPTIGSSLFRKHSVFFDPLSRLIGVCLARG